MSTLRSKIKEKIRFRSNIIEPSTRNQYPNHRQNERKKKRTEKHTKPSKSTITWITTVQ